MGMHRYGEASHLEETISTLQFAARVRLVPNEATLNTEQDPAMLVKRYAMQIADLKRELSMHNSLASRSRVNYEPYSDTQRAEMQNELERYLSGVEGASEIDLQSVRQMRELLSAMKMLYTKQQEEIDSAESTLAAGGDYGNPPGTARGGKDGEDGGEGEGEEGGPIGEEVHFSERGYAIGHAPDNAKPPGGLVEPPAYIRDYHESGGDDTAPVGATVVGTASTLTRSEAFNMFKATDGADKNTALLAAKREVKDAKQERVAAVGMVNATKARIDELKTARDAFTAKLGRSSPGDLENDQIIDEDEYNTITALKNAKNEYKQFSADMKAAVDKIRAATASVESTREALLTEFNEWYAETYGADAAAAAPEPVVEPVKTGDVMDDDEQFEYMQMAKVLEEQPDSLAFVRARKAVNDKRSKK